MRKAHKLLLATSMLVLIAAVVAMPAAANTCYGTYYEYYDGPAQNTIVGAKVSCPGYADQWDDQVVTPWYSTETVVCPCPSGSGGNNNDAEDTDDNAEEGGEESGG